MTDTIKRPYRVSLYAVGVSSPVTYVCTDFDLDTLRGTLTLHGLETPYQPEADAHAVFLLRNLTHYVVVAD